MATDTKTFLDDKESLKALVAMQTKEQQKEYADYKALAIEAVFPGRKMVAYRLKGGKPLDINLISFRDFVCNRADGPSADVQIGEEVFTISTIPRKLREADVFMHIPQNFVLKYKGKTSPTSAVDFTSHYAVLVKTRSPEIHQIEGHSYCVTLNKFRERFPDLKLRY